MGNQVLENSGKPCVKHPKSIRDWPESERPRERLLSMGADRLSTTELLAILLGSGCKGRSAIEVARECLEHQLSELTVQRLRRIGGLGPGKTARVLAGLELGRRLMSEEAPKKIRLRSSTEVYSYVRSYFLGKSDEVFVLLLVDTKNRPQKMIEIARGNGQAVHFLPGDLFRRVLAEECCALICLHNHPSGDPEPSPEDRRLTQHLKEGAQTLGLRLIDHLIIGKNTYYSFADHGWR